MAQSYAGRPKGDLSAMQAHCRSLREQFIHAAEDAHAIEQAHRQLARKKTNSNRIFVMPLSGISRSSEYAGIVS
jgi:tryptophan synthase beta subunit